MNFSISDCLDIALTMAVSHIDCQLQRQALSVATTERLFKFTMLGISRTERLFKFTNYVLLLSSMLGISITERLFKFMNYVLLLSSMLSISRTWQPQRTSE